MSIKIKLIQHTNDKDTWDGKSVKRGISPILIAFLKISWGLTKAKGPVDLSLNKNSCCIPLLRKNVASDNLKMHPSKNVKIKMVIQSTSFKIYQMRAMKDSNVLLIFVHLQTGEY